MTQHHLDTLADLTGLDRDRIDDALTTVGGLRPLLQRSEHELVKFLRFTPAAARRLHAAAELYRKLTADEIREVDLAHSPAAAARHIVMHHEVTGQEVLGAIFSDTRNKVIDGRVFFRGTINRAACEPTPILREGLMLRATSIILFHTHPSGDPSPSPEDVAFTERMKNAGDHVGIKLSDHIVVGSPTRWVSLRQTGRM